ncbi:CopD family protein [Glaciecola siphonariae]|uniref:Protoporphyrinogen IX oxidase n=1 Tax=Glaciecola siphonariae TaxID=521012 RepID=A0ABV9LRC3_9ALTE
MNWYVLIKTVHISAVVFWLAGMIFVALSLYLNLNAKTLSKVRQIDRAFFTPAMLTVWIFGMGLAYLTGAFGTGWLSLKIVLVLVLSGIHGVITGKLRRASIASSADVAVIHFSKAAYAIAPLLILIVYTVVNR